MCAGAVFLGLDADVGHRFFGGALHVAVAVGGNAHHGAFSDMEDVVVNLELAGACEDDVDWGSLRCPWS